MARQVVCLLAGPGSMPERPAVFGPGAEMRLTGAQGLAHAGTDGFHLDHEFL
jgi:hypothetical protein